MMGMMGDEFGPKTLPILSLQVLGALSSEKNLLMATLMWWAVCYSPADIVYTLATNKVVKEKRSL